MSRSGYRSVGPILWPQERSVSGWYSTVPAVGAIGLFSTSTAPDDHAGDCRFQDRDESHLRRA